LNTAVIAVGTGRHRSAPVPAPTGTGTYRHRPALTGLDRQKTGTDRPGLFYEVFVKKFLNIMPFWAI
jgi:hypothetical protein